MFPSSCNGTSFEDVVTDKVVEELGLWSRGGDSRSTEEWDGRGLDNGS